jgi:hypothetical protein
VFHQPADRGLWTSSGRRFVDLLSYGLLVVLDQSIIYALLHVTLEATMEIWPMFAVKALGGPSDCIIEVTIIEDYLFCLLTCRNNRHNHLGDTHVVASAL